LARVQTAARIWRISAKIALYQEHVVGNGFVAAMTMIGQYEIRELLGAGGIGQVHAAFDTVLEREVAIKSLRPELLNDKSFADRFRGEATSLAKLSHPNITTLYNLLSEGGNLYLIMECVRGETLEDLLKKRGGRLGLRESLAIITQVADGLTYAHSLGIVHRDIKPANLMITASGAVKIMDFGIARVRGSQRLTRDGGALGTLAYMSPEQVRGEEPDGRSDLYSLAIMLYEMLTGAVPFEADTDYELMQAHIKTRAPRLSSRLPGIDSRIEAALARGLAKNREQRFATAREFSDALGAKVLRPDASKIVHDGTRLIDAPRIEPEPSAPRSTLAPVLDRLTFIRPDLRLPVVIGAGGTALLGLAIAVVVLLTPMPPSSPSANSVAVASPAAPSGVNTTSPDRSAVPASPTTPSGGNATSPDRSAGVASPGAGSVKVATATPDPPASAQPTGPGSVTPVSLPNTTAPPSRPQLSPGNAKPVGASPPTALADIIQAAARGDPAAQNALGVKYAEGADGLPRDDTQAVEWYRKAAMQGYAGAETNLGDMYLFGRGGLDQSPLEALSWYLKAANQGWPDAQYRLGYMYETGLGTAKDPERAVALYRSAANSGYRDAENLLGVLYATGSDGLAQDDKKAVDWYRKAAEQGFPKAEKNLGDMYYFGRGVDHKDYALAISWYKKAADQNFAEAQFKLGFMYEKGLGTPANDEQAVAFYKQAASNGSVEAQRALDRLSATVGGNK
jgi:eukaryotic-like serine/threonine-protein kinase